MQTNLKKWLDALRSGDYNQEPGTLCATEINDYDEKVIVGYCCLGVLETIRTDKTPTGAYPPFEAADWLGVEILTEQENNEWNPALNITWEQVVNERLHEGIMGLDEYEDVHLAHLNDCGYSFRQIANLIETYGIKEN